MKMKKMFCLFLSVLLVFVMAGCSNAKTDEKKDTETIVSETTAQKAVEDEAGEWTRQGYFTDENDNMLSIIWMDDIDEPGWYVGCMIGGDPIENSWGGTLEQKGNTLQGTLPASGIQDDLTVTVSEDGADGITLAVDGGETYHFTADTEMQDASIIVTINTEDMGNISYGEGEEKPEIDTEYPYQSAQINLAEPATYTFFAWPQAGNVFVKWTKNGEDYSTDAQITVLLDESADYVAVSEEDPDWQNPVMNFVGEYQCDRAHAVVQCSGYEDASITIDWAGSAAEYAHWDISGRLDPETLTINYFGCAKSHLTYNENGEIVSQEQEYGDGTGTIVFNKDGSFTWHEDQSETGDDLVFEWLPVEN